MKLTIKSIKARGKVLRIYKAGKKNWEDEEIVNRFGKMIYTVQGRNWRHKRHLDKMKRRYVKEIKTQQRDLSLEVLYDAFDLPTPIINTRKHCVSKSKRNPKKILEMNPKKRKYEFKRECVS